MHSGLDITSLFWLMTIAAVVVMFQKHIKLPYEVILVIAGAVAGFLHFFEEVNLTPHLLFAVLLPPLLFDAAINLHFDILYREKILISVFAIVGVSVTAAVVGGLANLILGLPLIIAFLFGSIVSPTDPISVVALFKKFGVNKRLLTILDAESLFNDGVGVVLYTVMLGLVASGAVSVVAGFGKFFVLMGGGAIIGALIGAVASYIIKIADDNSLDILVTLLASFGAFLVAEAIHVSGVIAVIASGIVIGLYAIEKSKDHASKSALKSFWGNTAFLVNTVVFFLVGIEFTKIPISFQSIQLMLISALIVLVGRAAAVYGLSSVSRFLGDKFPLSWQHVLVWGGLRGALVMAMLLGLNSQVPYRDKMMTMAFGVVIFTLVIQGGTVEYLMKLLGLINKDKTVA